MTAENLDRQVKVKVQSDTDRKMAGMQRVQRKIRVQAASEGRQGENKALRAEGSPSQNLSIMGGNGSLGIGLALGMTLALVNDFSDLVFWQKMSLVSQTLDITTLIMLLLMVMFVSRAYFFSVFLVLVVFMLEIMPVLGVLPLWTIGVACWYFWNRQKD
jgi:hypothetical protein